MEVEWFVPILVKSLPFDVFFFAILLIMLERTVVFVSDDILKSSSAVLAMKVLLHPFVIYHSIVPVLPNAVIHNLEAPVPLLIGVKRSQLINNEIEMTSDTAINWIDLDAMDDNSACAIWSDLDHDVPVPHLNGLKEKV